MEGLYNVHGKSWLFWVEILRNVRWIRVANTLFSYNERKSLEFISVSIFNIILHCFYGYGYLYVRQPYNNFVKSY